MLNTLCTLVIAATAIRIDKETTETKPVGSDNTDQSFASMFFKRGHCPSSIEFHKDADLTKLEGKWFTHASLNSYNEYGGAECIHSSCKLDSEDTSLKSELRLLVNGK